MHGYSTSDGTISFHPLFPLLAVPITRLGAPPLLSLLLISSIAGLGLLFIFHVLLSLDLQPKDAFFGMMLLALSPISFIIFAPYPESLFLLFSVLCIYWSRKKSWWLAGVAGSLAVLTRQQGVFLLLPMAWELWEDAGRKFSEMLRRWKAWLSLLTIPVALLLWILYRALFLGDFKANFGSIQEIIFSILITPSTTQLVPSQQFVWPWQALYYSVSKLFNQPDADIVVNIIYASLFLIMLALSWRKLRISYRIYSLVITIISFSFYTGPVHPYMSLPRHLFLAFPVIIGSVLVIQKPWARLLVISLSTVGMSFLLMLFVLQAWIP
jgi:hypothetical protein